MTDSELLALATRTHKNHNDMKNDPFVVLRRVISILIACKVMKEAVNAGDVLWPNSTKTVLEIATLRYNTWKKNLADMLPRVYADITMQTIVEIGNAVSVSWARQQIRGIYGMMVMGPRFNKSKQKRQVLRKFINFKGEQNVIKGKP